MMRNKLKSILKSFSAKVTIIICIIMVICSLIWTCVVFVNMRDNAINNLITEEKTYVEKTTRNINNVEEVCNMALQIVSQLDSITEYIENVQSGHDLDTEAKIDFYNNDIASIYNITNLNPYLYQIRLFVDAEHITEKKPCLYYKERMYNLEWADNRKDGKWIMDYPDTVFPESVGNYHLAGITKTMYNSKGEELGILEVSTQMSSLFPEIYTVDADSWACFIDDAGTIHYNENDNRLPSNLDSITKYADADSNGKIFTTTIDGDSVVLSSTRIESFGGTYIHATSLSSSINSYYESQRIYIYVVIFTIILCVFVVALIITNMFKRFNIITESIKRIKKGQTDLRIEMNGDDEISEMSHQINQMLDTLQTLNEENTTRQLIVKNTEIKSLQNQINAHFMYNVLESIKMMAEIRGEFDISDAVTSLGEMFRYSVKWTSGKVALSEEIKYIRNYLALMNIRLDYEIILALRIPEDLLNYKIPKMSLQPIVENSVMHGIEGIGKDTSIYVKAFVIDNILHIEVSDTGKGMTSIELHNLKEKLKGQITLDESTVHGLALKNVQNRIKMYYGDEYGLEIYSEEGLYTKVVLLMPYEQAEEGQDYE